MIRAVLAVGLAAASMGAAVAAETSLAFIKPRLVVLTDVGNEPDDQMSLVRLMLYSNEIDIEGLVATTSVWLRDKTNPQTIQRIVEAYGQVRQNLLLHASGWPEASQLLNTVSTGRARYGMAAIGTAEISAGAQALIAAADRPDTRPLWVSVWGGANTLAEALQHLRVTRSSAQVDAFVSKLKVYSISDQDDAGPWIRREFPKLFYIVSPSSEDGSEYASATWTGISGDVYYRNGQGADGTTITNDWLDANVRNKGPLSKHYPNFEFIMEGDTPAFLGLTNNGLASAINPSWGGWGGRYVLRQPRGEARPIWTQGGDEFSRVTSRDAVTGVDGRTCVSDQATIWRWRTAFQNEFAARMDWTIKPYKLANHSPVVVVNGMVGTSPINLTLNAGDSVVLNASGSRDPDGQALRYQWFSYPEAGFTSGERMGAVDVANADTPTATVTAHSECLPVWRPWGGGPCSTTQAHVILAVTDNGVPALTSYRRVILTIRRASAKP